MLKIKIGQTDFVYLRAIEREEFYNGSSRRTMTVTCPKNAINLDTLNNLLTEDNLVSISMSNDENGTVNIYDNYVLKLSCGIQQEQIRAESVDTPAQYDDVIVFKIGKRTYIEEQLKKLGL